MPDILTPDLKQNLIVTIYLLFTHNYIALAYSGGLVIGIILAIFKPSRFSVFIFLGFSILLFSYEYDKHIIVALREQTIKSLITITPHFRLQRLINLIISDLLPIVLYSLGWFFIYLAIIFAAFKLRGKE